ncbi:MAG: hypothetical protein K6G03_03570 [Lachnospiraceae bacterium]|nr:hypothetical protein [Lachnospiraceae bacterium]
MNKKIVAIFTTLAISALAVVPAFASPASEIAAAQAAQDARNSYISAEKQRLADAASSELAKGEAAKAAGKAAVEAGQMAISAFRNGELTKGETAKEVGKAAEEAGQKAVKAFYESELAKGETAKAIGKAAEEGNPVKAFQAGQKALEEAEKLDRAEVQKKVNAYLSSL